MPGSCDWFPMKHEEIVAWADAHRDTLPHSLAEISQYPVPFRKVIVNKVSPEVRIELWREHLTSFIGEDCSLTSEQQQLVRDAVADLPAIFAPSRTPFADRVNALEGRMRELLSRRQAAEMFGMLGPPEPAGGLPLPQDVHPRSIAD